MFLLAEKDATSDIDTDEETEIMKEIRAEITNNVRNEMRGELVMMKKAIQDSSGANEHKCVNYSAGTCALS